MFANYDSPDHHLAKRSGLTAELRKLLFDTPKAEWGSHNNYWRGADMWQAIHRSLLHESGLFVTGLEELIDMPKGEMESALLLSNLRQLGGHLVGHAHVHHHVEDDHYFPRFKQVFPQLGQPIRPICAALLKGWLMRAAPSHRRPVRRLPTARGGRTRSGPSAAASAPRNCRARCR